MAVAPRQPGISGILAEEDDPFSPFYRRGIGDRNQTSDVDREWNAAHPNGYSGDPNARFWQRGPAEGAQWEQVGQPRYNPASGGSTQNPLVEQNRAAAANIADRNRQASGSIPIPVDPIWASSGPGVAGGTGSPATGQGRSMPGAQPEPLNTSPVATVARDLGVPGARADRAAAEAYPTGQYGRAVDWVGGKPMGEALGAPDRGGPFGAGGVTIPAPEEAPGPSDGAKRNWTGSDLQSQEKRQGDAETMSVGPNGQSRDVWRTDPLGSTRAPEGINFDNRDDYRNFPSNAPDNIDRFNNFAEQAGFPRAEPALSQMSSGGDLPNGWSGSPTEVGATTPMDQSANYPTGDTSVEHSGHGITGGPSGSESVGFEDQGQQNDQQNDPGDPFSDTGGFTAPDAGYTPDNQGNQDYTDSFGQSYI